MLGWHGMFRYRRGPRPPPPARPRAPGARHNIDDIPNIDYFARKVSQQNDSHDQLMWMVGYGKPEGARPLPSERFLGEGLYLTAMQCHVASEFQAAAAQGMKEAVDQPGEGWYSFDRNGPAARGERGTVAFVNNAEDDGAKHRQLPPLDFEDESWHMHLIEASNGGPWENM